MLTVLDELARWQNKDPGEFDLDGFKIVYIAPMKALVQEMVGHLQTRLVSKPASSLVILKRLSNKSPRRRLSSPQQKNGKSSLARVPVPAILTLFALSSLMRFTYSMMIVDLFSRPLLPAPFVV